VLPVLGWRPADLFGVQLAWRDRASEARRRLEQAFWPAAQAAASAGLAWYVAHDLLGHAQPFFAPIAAAISLSSSGVRRGRRILQLVVGVALGIGVGEGVVALAGTGPLQIVAVVAVAMAVALLTGFGVFGEGMMFVNQSVASAILVVALHKNGTGAERLVDALIGGGVAAVIGVGLFPTDPLAVIRNAEREVLRSVSGALAELAQLLSQMRPAAPGWTLAAAQDIHRQLAALVGARVTARATARIAPRRRRLRDVVATEDARISHFDLMANAVLSLFRTAVGAIDAGEAIPADLTEAVEELASALARLTQAPQPWTKEVLVEVTERVTRTVASVAPQTPARAPLLAALVRETGRDVLAILPRAAS
jgi:uncharacterized membrane protein YgaE (UPF0421/DUF939 family)